jgi:hypothetical protein
LLTAATPTRIRKKARARRAVEQALRACRAPIDPLADDVIKTLYGKILLITIPLLTLGGMILGYVIMTAQTTGETAYSARAVTPRFVVGATLSVLGIFLVSVFVQFVAATDLAMIGVAIPGNAVGGPDAWPASGGVLLWTYLDPASVFRRSLIRM